MTFASVAAALGQRAHAASRIALYLDFDGTLAPIVTRHEEARLPEATRETLLRLTHDPRLTIAIVSGRAIPDLRERVSIPGLIYVGNHGLEIEGPDISFRHAEAAACEERLTGATADLQQRLLSIPGAGMENKGLTASVHFRRVPPEQHAHVRALVHSVVPPDDPQLILRDAKMVLEIRPRLLWNKGEAVLWIRRKLDLPDPLEIYIGDDATDEDAFAALPLAFTVHVGAGPTLARYRVADTLEVKVLLQCILVSKGTFDDAG